MKKIHANNRPTSGSSSPQAHPVSESERSKSKAPSVKAIMHRISSLTQAAAKHGPASFAFALREIDTAARTFWKQARA